MPVVIIWLIIKVKDLLNSFLVNFSSLLDIPSCPELFLFSRLPIAFKVSVSVIHLNTTEDVCLPVHPCIAKSLSYCPTVFLFQRQGLPLY